MDSWQLVGLALVLTALPGLGFGVVLVTGLWQPGALKAAVDPDALRRSVGLRVLAIAGAVSALGLTMILLRS